MIGTDFIHPALFFLALALLLAVWRGPKFRYLLLLPGLAAVCAIIFMRSGHYMQMDYLGVQLTMGRVDKLSIVFAHVFALQAIIGFIYAWHIREKGQHIAAALYIAGAFGSTFAGDFLTLFIFWEIMAVSSTFLIWLNRAQKSLDAGFRYFLFHTLGGLFLLAGIVLKFKTTGTFAFEAIDPAQAGFADYLVLIGFAVNAAVIPLHAWLPDAYPEATITGAVFLSAFTTKTAVYVLARGFSGFPILAVAGTIMAVYGVFYATIENNARRILAYHIVSQVGYMVAGIGIGTAMTVNGACAHAYAHIIYKGLLFMGAGCLLYATGTARLTEMGGLIAKLPLVFIAYMVGAVSISGFPLFSGFVSKTMVISGTAEAHHAILALGLELAAVGTFLSVGIKLPFFAFYGPNTCKRPVKPLPLNMYVAMFLASFLCLLIGIYPNFLYSLLPFPVHYKPYTAWHLTQSLQLLAFTGLGFYLLRRRLKPSAKINIDFDYLYRLTGRIGLRLCRRPVEILDSVWSEVYARLGLRAMTGLARGSAEFDREEIDRVVDNTAYGFMRLGKRMNLLQSGNLQDYLAMAAFIALIIFALAFFI